MRRDETTGAAVSMFEAKPAASSGPISNCARVTLRPSLLIYSENAATTRSGLTWGCSSACARSKMSRALACADITPAAWSRGASPALRARAIWFRLFPMCPRIWRRAYGRRAGGVGRGVRRRQGQRRAYSHRFPAFKPPASAFADRSTRSIRAAGTWFRCELLCCQ